MIIYDFVTIIPFLILHYAIHKNNIYPSIIIYIIIITYNVLLLLPLNFVYYIYIHMTIDMFLKEFTKAVIVM